MTQPNEAVDVATNDEPVIAAEPTIEDRFAALAEEIQESDEPADLPQGDEVEDDTEAEAEITEDDLEPIAPPVSWPDEDKDAFKDLPRALQERVSAREADREKFIQSKSREASQAAQVAQNQALERIQQVQKAHIQQLVALLPEVPPEPSAHLMVQDPETYAAELDYARQMRAYRGQLERQIYSIAEAQQEASRQQAAAMKQARDDLLRTELPEVFDTEKGPELIKSIESTAHALGYSNDQLQAADGHDILALNRAMAWKTKADKYDALMAKQMEKVRAAKSLPRVSRPGSAPAKGAVANQRYTADRQAMREGDRDAAVRVFSRFV